MPSIVSAAYARFTWKYVRMSIEAGGNAPFIVFDDADIGAAVEGEFPLFDWPHLSI